MQVKTTCGLVYKFADRMCMEDLKDYAGNQFFEHWDMFCSMGEDEILELIELVYKSTMHFQKKDRIRNPDKLRMAICDLACAMFMSSGVTEGLIAKIQDKGDCAEFGQDLIAALSTVLRFAWHEEIQKIPSTDNDS